MDTDNRSEESEHSNERENEMKPKRRFPSLDDPYKHAPPKPDGDPWAILLKPEMETDKVQCDAWKDEVQTLLIFAGLFSAVVTAFIIESYKFLQPDPNDTVISLLSQIANAPNITSSPLSTRSSTSTSAPFTQAAPSIRINVFWFLSLILSLATVLIGTIALQWLREHQAYPAFSSKQSLAVLRMRTEALERWHVPQIFAALPLLLQTALVLFFAGLIEFTRPLGLKLTVPVACIIGLILLFLTVTTVLPALQGLLLLSGRFSRDTVPSPCAFKSPQSQAFHALSALFLLFLYSILPHRFMWQIYHDVLLIPHMKAIVIQTKRSWPTCDLEWLSLRDTWHNRILAEHIGLVTLGLHRDAARAALPLSDITQCLVKITDEPTSGKHTDEFLNAACHCFQELSESVWKNENFHIDYIDRLNYYLEKLYRPPRKSTAPSISNFLMHGGKYKYSSRSNFKLKLLSQYLKQHRTLFYQDQMYLFRAMLLQNHSSEVLEPYQQEIQQRIVPYLLENKFEHFEGSTRNQNTEALPPEFQFTYREVGKVHISYWPQLLATLVENVGSRSTQDQQINPLYTHYRVGNVLHIVANGIITYLDWMDAQPYDASASYQLDLDKTDAEYGATFRMAAKYLNDTISTSEISPNAGPVYILFYHVAMILQPVLRAMHARRARIQNSFHVVKSGGFGQGLSILFNAVMDYRERIGDRRNAAIEKWFEEEDNIYIMSEWFKAKRFSTRWWAALVYNYSHCYGITVNPAVLRNLASESTSDESGSSLSPSEDNIGAGDELEVLASSNFSMNILTGLTRTDNRLLSSAWTQTSFNAATDKPIESATPDQAPQLPTPSPAFCADDPPSRHPMEGDSVIDMKTNGRNGVGDEE